MTTLVTGRRRFIEKLQAEDGDRRKKIAELEEKIVSLEDKVKTLKRAEVK